MDDRRPGREVAVSLWCEALADCPDGLAPCFCLHCHAPLDLHQPDPVRPDRMLATCATCLSWHLIDCDSGTGPSVILLLPAAAAVTALLHGG